MRRGISISVLAVLLSALVAPLALASAAPVPACCRAGAKHHCEMSLGDSGLAGFKSGSEVCPYRIHAAITSPLLALSPTAHHIAIFVLSGETAQPTKLALSTSDSDDAHKRGPPAI
jgi:hypothetical protein